MDKNQIRETIARRAALEIKNGKVVNVSVAIHTAICPECGRSYVSGGTTSSMVKYNTSNPYQANQKNSDQQSMIGANVDLQA